MIKGKATIQLFDEKTGEVVRELHEENMITNAVDTILNPPDYIEIGMDSDNDRSFNMLRDFAGNIADTAFRGVIVCRDKIPEDGNNMMLPWTNEEIGHAGIANTNTDTSIGTYNANESGRIENGKGYRHVWDFASDKANGEISCICLTTKDGGTNGMHHSYWNLSCGGTDLNSISLDYADEKTNTPLVICDSCNISYSLLALEIIKSGEDYGRYRMRFSAPTYGNSYLYSYANLIKTDELNLPLYILPYYPYSSGSQHFFGFALGICKLCLTTINNLSEPVRKLDGQVMKITYDIVDE